MLIEVFGLNLKKVFHNYCHLSYKIEIWGVTLMQQSDIISAAKQYMESIHQNDFTGHDIAHVYRHCFS